MMNEIVSGHIRKSLSNIKSALILYENEIYDGAVNASYYAVFHGVSALLAIKNMEFKTHKTLISKYNDEYIRTGLIGNTSFKALTALFNRRHESEYNATVVIGPESAQAAMQQAQAAVDEIMEYCKQHGITE